MCGIVGQFNFGTGEPVDANAVRTIQPRIVYPYHFGKTDTSQLVRLLSDLKNVAVRIRKLP